MDKEYKILVLAETGFIIRNLLLGTFPQELDPRVTLLAAVPNPEDESLKSFAGSRIRFIPFPRDPLPVVNHYSRLKRITNFPYFVYRVGEGFKPTSSTKLASKVFDSLSSPWFLLSKWIYFFLGRMVKWFGLGHAFTEFSHGVVRRQKKTGEWEQILKELQPDLVISTMLTLTSMYSISSDLPVVVAAGKLKIKCGCIVQSWDNIFTKPSMLPASMVRYWTWSEFMSKHLQKFYPYLNPKSICLIGGLQFDFHGKPGLIEKKEEYFRTLGLDPSKPYVLFTTGTRRNFPYEDEAVISIIKLILKKDLGVQMVIRLHPKDYGYRWKTHEAFLRTHGVPIQKTSLDIPMDAGGMSPPEEFYKEQINIIHYSSAVINTGSTTTVDAAIIGKPSIWLNWDVRPDKVFPQGRAHAFLTSSHLGPIWETGGVFVAKDKYECVAQIQECLNNPDIMSKERKDIINMITERADGKAGTRLARDVEKILADAKV